jgi:hypothetical protein
MAAIFVAAQQNLSMVMTIDTNKTVTVVVEQIDNNIVVMNDYVEDDMLLIDQRTKKFAKL